MVKSLKMAKNHHKALTSLLKNAIMQCQDKEAKKFRKLRSWEFRKLKMYIIKE